MYNVEYVNDEILQYYFPTEQSLVLLRPVQDILQISKTPACFVPIYEYYDRKFLKFNGDIYLTSTLYIEDLVTFMGWQDLVRQVIDKMLGDYQQGTKVQQDVIDKRRANLIDLLSSDDELSSDENDFQPLTFGDDDSFFENEANAIFMYGDDP